MFVYKRPYVFFKQPDDFRKHQGVFKNIMVVSKLSKGALPNAQGSEGLHLRGRKPTLP